MVPSKLFLKGGPLQVQVLSTSENAVPRHPSVIHVQKSDKITLFSKVFLTWAACLENDYFFFLSYELWHFPSFCRISGSFTVETRNTNSDREIREASSQTWNVPNCWLTWAAATMPAKELSILPECPLHPVLPEQSECCVTAMCHFEICTDLHIFCSANQGTHSSETRVLGGRECTPSLSWKIPSAFHTFLLNRAKYSKYSFMSVQLFWKLCLQIIYI